MYSFKFEENAQAPCRCRSTVTLARLVQLTPRYVAAVKGKIRNRINASAGVNEKILDDSRRWTTMPRRLGWAVDHVLIDANMHVHPAV